MNIKIFCLIFFTILNIFFIPVASSSLESRLIISQSNINTQPTPVPLQNGATNEITSTSLPSPIQQPQIDIPVLTIASGPQFEVLNKERFLIVSVKPETTVNYKFILHDNISTEKITPKALYLPKGAIFKLLKETQPLNDNPNNISYDVALSRETILSWKPTKQDAGFHPVVIQVSNNAGFFNRVTIYFYVQP